MRFAATLKELRELNHVTQKELADHLKVTRSTIAGYETKGKQPDFERLLHIAAFFRVSVDYLLTGFDKGTITISGPSSGRIRRLLAAYLHLSEKSQGQLEEYLELLELREHGKKRP